MTTRTYEVALPVSAYIDEEDSEYPYAFDDARDDREEAAAQFKREAEEAGVNVTKIVEVQFEDFDGSNPHSANAFFSIIYEGDPFPED